MRARGLPDVADKPVLLGLPKAAYGAWPAPFTGGAREAVFLGFTYASYERELLMGTDRALLASGHRESRSDQSNGTN